ncbi:hypothetical protein lerEdw1_007357 [Lerista edwardsae]|nr:hypothetical protein lerEdw1_007357 [Lerista edwardsae]
MESELDPAPGGEGQGPTATLRGRPDSCASNPHVPLDTGGLSSGGHKSPQTRFQIDEYDDDEDAFPMRGKAPQGHKLTWETDGASSPGSPASNETPSPGQQEPRSRIGSFPPLLESETSDEPGAFRARSHSAPPVLLAAQRYGRELRRMSDEFHGALQKMPRPQSAGTASQMQQTAGWKETLQWWWRRSFPGSGPPWSPP